MTPMHLGQGSLWDRYLALSGPLDLFFWCNVGIFLGYLLVGVKLAWRLPFRKRTVVAAGAFFITCGLTHLEHAAHLLVAPTTAFADLADDSHMLLVHLVQVVAVWTFVPFLVTDLLRLVDELVKMRGERHELRNQLAAYRLREEERAAVEAAGGHLDRPDRQG